MARRKQHVPWTRSGHASEEQHSADEVVRETGWVFNNVTGDELDLAEFVETGDHEVAAYLEAFGLRDRRSPTQTLVEIGVRHRPDDRRVHPRVRPGDRLRPRRRVPRALPRDRRPVRHRRAAAAPCHVADGRTLDIADDSPTSCSATSRCSTATTTTRSALAREAVRVTKPGGHDRPELPHLGRPPTSLLWPAGKVMRALWRMPGARPGCWPASAWPRASAGRPTA